MDVFVPGGKIHTVNLGTSKKSLLVIHGGPDWDHSYLRSAGELLSLNRKVILFDIRGCGKSSKFEDISQYTIDNIVADIKCILNAYGIACCDVLGFSFGGVVATHLLDQHPELVDKLILASTTCFEDYQDDLNGLPEYLDRNTPEIQNLVRYSFTKAPAIDDEPSRTMALKTISLDVYDLDKLDSIKLTIERVTFSSEWIKAFRKGLIKTKTLDGVEIVGRKNTNVLIIHGEKDFRFPVSAAIKLHGLLPKTKLVILADVGHLAHLEKQDKWVDEINKFLN
ncbi:alpha/beta fold hydrolase [Aliivibrio kagoshimensis]|uniref:alpha/beta fold hydrolase n=1 Tax=Aliivibrio kagoshimensis TaxID=2910230 RepID=UPI003D0F8206